MSLTDTPNTSTILKSLYRFAVLIIGDSISIFGFTNPNLNSILLMGFNILLNLVLYKRDNTFTRAVLNHFDTFPIIFVIFFLIFLINIIIVNSYIILVFIIFSFILIILIIFIFSINFNILMLSFNILNLKINKAIKFIIVFITIFFIILFILKK